MSLDHEKWLWRDHHPSKSPWMRKKNALKEPSCMLLLFSHSVASESVRPRGLQQADYREKTRRERWGGACLRGLRRWPRKSNCSVCRLSHSLPDFFPASQGGWCLLSGILQNKFNFFQEYFSLQQLLYSFLILPKLDSVLSLLSPKSSLPAVAFPYIFSCVFYVLVCVIPLLLLVFGKLEKCV